MQIQANMKKLRLGFLVVMVPMILAACGGDGSCDANFYSFKNCLNSSSSSSSSSVPVVYYPVGGNVSGLGLGKTVKLSLVTNHAAVAFAVSSASTATFPGAGTVGWSFTLDSIKTLTHLGLYNTDLSADTTVGIWNSGGALVKSVIITTSLTGVDLDDLSNSGFLWLPVLNQTLQTGSYTIGAFSPLVLDQNGKPVLDQSGNPVPHFGAYTGSVVPTVVTDFHIQKSSLISTDSSPTKPTTDQSSNYSHGFFGPNLRFLTGDQQITVDANGAFTFPTTIADGDHYLLTVNTQPTGQVCVVANGSGMVAGSSVTNIVVTCSP